MLFNPFFNLFIVHGVLDGDVIALPTEGVLLLTRLNVRLSLLVLVDKLTVAIFGVSNPGASQHKQGCQWAANLALLWVVLAMLP